MKQGPIIEAVYGLGTVKSAREYSIRPAIPAAVLQVFVTEGQDVKAGTPLLRTDSMVFRAPFDGTVVSPPAMPGEVSMAGPVMLRMLDPRDRYVELILDQEAAPGVRKGQKAELSIESVPGIRYHGVVERVYPSEGEFLVRLRVEDLPDTVLPDMTLDVAIEVSRRENASLIGIDPVRQRSVTNLATYVTEGKLDDLSRGNSGVMIGSELMLKLGARMGDVIMITEPGFAPVRLSIIAVFATGNRVLDGSRLYASIPTVQKITRKSGEISDIAVRLYDARRAREIAQGWAQWSRDKVESWDIANATILNLFKMQDIVRNSISAIIVLVVAFGIYNILNMVVNQKHREIAILRSIGFTSTDTIWLFLNQGFILAATGAITGIFLGIGVCAYLATLQIGSGPFARNFTISYDLWIYIRADALTMGSSLITSWLPARLASRRFPIEIIRGAA